MNDFLIAVILVLVIFLCLVLGGFAFVDIFIDRLREVRARRTPPCSQCVHSTLGETEDYICTCPSAIDQMERDRACVVYGIKAHGVRGKSCCKFEPMGGEDK